ncbi:MAG: zinc ribbon domain-containing protein [Candidatus Methylacidiphilales bacterium]
MSDVIESLLILQNRDQRKMQIEADLARIPKEEAVIRQNLATQSKDYEEHKKQALQIEVRRKELDTDVKSREAQISKYLNQQLQTKKNEEYQALGHEIERTRQEISALEDRELELMEQYEKAQQEVAREAVKVKEYQNAAATRQTSLTEKKVNLEKELTQVVQEIAAQEANCEPSALSLYRRILTSKGDSAVARIDDGKFCGGCHMALTHQDILSAKAGRLSHCGNCGRILYWQNEFA